MANQTVTYQVSDQAARLTLNRPERRNAFDAAMLALFQKHLAEADRDVQVRVIVVAAEGSSFCAGADLRGDGNRPAGELAAEAVVELARTLDALAMSSKPVVASVQGPTVGGGLGFVAASDVVVATRGATFTLREVRVGAVPAVVAVPLRERLSQGALRELMLTSNTLNAARAHELGLVDRVTDDLSETTRATVGELLAGAPNAQAATKALLLELPRLSQSERWRRAIEVSQEHFESAEAAEGMAAFADKRKPNW